MLQLYKPLNNKKTARHTEVLCNVDVNLANRYEVKLQSELKVLQQQAEEDVKQKKKEISDVFDNKVLMFIDTHKSSFSSNNIYFVVTKASK